ncbi:hypothetical protein OMK64_10670 [Cellulomonas fimi]|uniref:8-oxoguanine DNA glycosylase OGG fold protein n=1 Tax=Cellulomonas fimi TaxID=1708 RepID=UPI00234DF9E6|nr:hypothetical protein [Cellulomonas fimi]MDC7121999.1 hypothetical protein [Cellulomonas fimi]
MTTVPVALHALLTTTFEPAPPVRWHRAHWRQWADRMGPEFRLPDVDDAVDREDAAALVHEELERGRTVPAFVAAMVWAYGTAHDGPYRTATVLGGRRRPTEVRPEVVAALDDAVGTARDATSPAGTGPDAPTAPAPAGSVAGDAARSAHRRIVEHRLHGLAPAGLTAWLHFASARRDPYAPHAVPVLDDDVRAWLATDADLPLRDGHPDDYGRYVDRLVTWGRPFGRTPVQVESSVRTLVVAGRAGSGS